MIIEILIPDEKWHDLVQKINDLCIYRINLVYCTYIDACYFEMSSRPRKYNYV